MGMKVYGQKSSEVEFEKNKRRQTGPTEQYKNEQSTRKVDILI